MGVHVFVSTRTDFKGPRVTQFIINKILQLHASKGIAPPNTVVVDTDNCPGHFKTCEAVLTCQEIGKIWDCNVLGFQNVGNHGKGMSDGVGGATKRAWDRGSLGVNPKIDAGSSHADWGASLVQFGNVHLSKAAVGQAGRLLFRRFYTFAVTADWECLAQVPGKFPI